MHDAHLPVELALKLIHAEVQRRLGELLPSAAAPPQRLHAAMRYSLLGDGKRLRPLIVTLTAETLGAPRSSAIDPACAIEMIHAASLIFDDLPSMDDAATRRGQPANHVVYGEGTATLAAISLLNRSFGVLGAAPNLDAETRVDLVACLSAAIGTEGLAGGQEADLNEVAACAEVANLEMMQHRKTGALFVASAETGARIAGIRDGRLEAMREYGRRLGLAFQILDDLVDAFADENGAGKDVGQDDGKPTFVSVLGPAAAEDRAADHVEAAMAAVSDFGEKSRPFGRFLQLVLDCHLQRLDRGDALDDLRRRIAAA